MIFVFPVPLYNFQERFHHIAVHKSLSSWSVHNKTYSVYICVYHYKQDKYNRYTNLTADFYDQFYFSET